MYSKQRDFSGCDWLLFLFMIITL